MRNVWHRWLRIALFLGTIQMVLLLTILYVLFYPILRLASRSPRGEWIRKDGSLDLRGQG